MIVLKSPEEIAALARAGSVVAAALEHVAAHVRPGVSTRDLDELAETIIRDHRASPSFKGYRGFPATLCTSVDDQIVHGIPSADVVLEAGQLVSIDCGAVVDGFHGDSAVTLIVGGEDTVAPEVAALVRRTRDALWRGLEQVVAGNRLGDVGAAIEAVANEARYGVVREYVGHGIGRALHEEPSVPNYGTAGRGSLLATGWVIAVEPMFNLGSARTRTLADGWTVVTDDGSLSAHWEHTIAITDEGPRVLTARSGEPSRPAGGTAAID